MILLVAIAAIAVAAVVVIQLLPIRRRAPVVGATQVALRDNRFQPPVIQTTRGQIVTWYDPSDRPPR